MQVEKTTPSTNIIKGELSVTELLVLITAPCTGNRRALPSYPEQPGGTRAIPSDPERTRAIPSEPERSRAVPSGPERVG